MLKTDDSLRIPVKSGGTPLAASRWAPPKAPRAVIVVAHGMGEHRRRYKAPFAALVAAGYIVYAADHRGHGETVTDKAQLGDYGPAGYAGVVDDLTQVIAYARQENPGLPLILFGHSMGSMISQGLVIDHAKIIDALVLCGSCAVDVVAAAAATRDVLGTINATFQPERTPFDWLSRDNAQVDAYLADPLCGFGLTPESFMSLFGQGPRLADPASLARIPKKLPIYIMSGDRDPLAGDFNALQPLIERYRAAGLSVDVKIYPGGRHEILNETNRSEVVADLLAWCDRTVAARSAA